MKLMKSEIRDNMQIDWDAPIRMDDGVVLRADVYRPVGVGKYPIILSYGPYAKGLSFQEGYKSQWSRVTKSAPNVLQGSSNKYQNWELVDPEKWVPDGYSIVRVDSRGAGRSPGTLDVWSAREARDLYECVEWAGTQAWSNGKVGINGISYYAMNQWNVGALRPPHLAALCIWEGSSDYYRELTHHGGILCDFLNSWHPRQVASVQHGVGNRGAKSLVTGEPVAGPETLPKEELTKICADTPGEAKRHVCRLAVAVGDFDGLDDPAIGQNPHPQIAAAERVALDRLAMQLAVRDPHQGVRLPSLPERLAIEHRLDVVQTDVELGARDREDLLVVREWIDADTERRHPRRRPISEEVLPPLETVDVWVEESQALPVRVHRPLLRPRRAVCARR